MHFEKTKTTIIAAGIFLTLFVFTDKIAYAGTFTYKTLEALPGFFISGSSPDLPELILAIYKFGIWTIGIAGLFMLTIGGFMYMASAGNNARVTTAKAIIADSLLGVAAAMCAYLVMYVINPDLTSLNPALVTADVTLVTEAPETTAESAGTLPGATVTGVVGGSGCGGLNTQTPSIASQCSATSPQLAALLTCIKTKLPTAVITSITDSKGYANCAGSKWSRPPCAHSHYSCHYGGRTCFSESLSYAADLSTRNGMSAKSLIDAATACGADYTKNEAASANHVHVSVGKSAGCHCQ